VPAPREGKLPGNQRVYLGGHYLIIGIILNRCKSHLSTDRRTGGRTDGRRALSNDHPERMIPLWRMTVGGRLRRAWTARERERSLRTFSFSLCLSHARDISDSSFVRNCRNSPRRFVARKKREKPGARLLKRALRDERYSRAGTILTYAKQNAGNAALMADDGYRLHARVIDLPCRRNLNASLGLLYGRPCLSLSLCGRLEVFRRELKDYVSSTM